MSTGSGEQGKREFTGPLATAFGSYYPKHYVVAVIHDPAAAQRARESLASSGFDGDRVRLHESAEVLDNHQAYQSQRGLIQRVEARFAAEEEDALQQYLDEARRGAMFVTVHAPDGTERERAVGVLREHGGHAMKYYGDWSIQDLA